MQADPTESLAQSGESEKSSTKVLDSIDIRLVARLPIMSQVLSRLFDACIAGEASTDELAAILSLDPGIAAKVITVASSSVIDESTRPSNLTQCVTLVGVDVIKTIAINESTTRVFGRLSEYQEFALTRIWIHALRCALLARELAVTMHYSNPEEAYLAGLLHDIGSLALMTIDPNGYPQLLNRGHDDNEQCRLELKRYRATHAGVGTWIVEKWQLDSFLSDSIRYHHMPVERLTTAHPLIRIVLLANHLSHVNMASNRGGAIEFALLCGAPPGSVARLIKNTNEDLKRIAKELGITLETSDVEPEPTSGLHALPNYPIRELESKLEEKLLLDSALSLIEEANNLDTTLQGIAQAVLMLFGLQPSVFFLREGHSEAFVGKALLPRHVKVNQLRFLTMRTDSVLSTAVSGTPTVRFVRDSWREPLDAQLARLLDAEGVFCIPMGAGAKCKGLIISAISSQHHADLLHGKMDMFRSFGKLAGTMLGKHAIAEEKRAISDTPSDFGASPEQIRHLLHEVSNPLSIVRNYLATLEVSVGQNAIGNKELRIVAEEIDRVSQILDHFQQAPSAPPIAAVPIELRQLLEGIIDLCQGSGLAPPLVNIETSFLAKSPVIIASPDKLKQVLLNLLKNAFEAMPKGGVLRISTSTWSGGGINNYVEIMVEDSGPGLPEEIQRNLYQPTTSTKGGQHFGIGLSIAGQLVREMTGLISCHSDQNGSCFRIILPVQTP